MPSIDPMTNLAFSMKSNPGVYALLLGSGVSSAAGIPTGWGIVLDLIKQLAAAAGEQPADPVRWYQEQHGTGPDYSDLLDALGGTAAERRSIVASYIEPTDDDREQGLKVPTAAHRAAARLVSKGYVRVIVTTNFDRLIETALQDEGVSFDMIASVDAIRGARPLVHSPCVVVKVHGDYLDARIRNTTGELLSYDAELDAYLDRIFDEHGLVVAGWSATWDPALRAAILRQPSRRYSLFWLNRSGTPTREAVDLIEARGGVVVDGMGADEFLGGLVERIEALEDFDTPHPLSVAAAVAECKRHLVSREHRIKLHDLLTGEARRLCAALDPEQYPTQARLDNDAYLSRLAEYRAQSGVLLALLTTTSAWADTDEQHDLAVEVLNLVANRPKAFGGMTNLVSAQHYPAVLSFYAMGLAALARGNWPMLRRLLEGGSVTSEPDLGVRRFVDALLPWSFVRDQDPQVLIPGDNTRRYTPVSDHLHAEVRDPLKSLIFDDREYEKVFDRWEYLMALAAIHAGKKDGAHFLSTYIGRHAWKSDYRYNEIISPEHWVLTGANSPGEWPPLVEGMFDSDPSAVVAANEELRDGIRRSNIR